mmetsp:Transcript_30043/g.87858  ORF Transcript_30043/g.87858 Transcript_30043/m.87858 type:complete len:248 (+) Transcript_30043:107-850(+)
MEVLLLSCQGRRRRRRQRRCTTANRLHRTRLHCTRSSSNSNNDLLETADLSTILLVGWHHLLRHMLFPDPSMATSVPCFGMAAEERRRSCRHNHPHRPRPISSVLQAVETGRAWVLRVGRKASAIHVPMMVGNSKRIRRMDSSKAGNSRRGTTSRSRRQHHPCHSPATTLKRINPTEKRGEKSRWAWGLSRHCSGAPAPTAILDRDERLCRVSKVNRLRRRPGLLLRPVHLNLHRSTREALRCHVPT